jgi:hypothetical protein
MAEVQTLSHSAIRQSRVAPRDSGMIIEEDADDRPMES